jgi:hypothetical protein
LLWFYLIHSSDWVNWDNRKLNGVPFTYEQPKDRDEHPEIPEALEWNRQICSQSCTVLAKLLSFSGSYFLHL